MWGKDVLQQVVFEQTTPPPLSPLTAYPVKPAKLFGISPPPTAANENVAWNFNNSRTIPRGIDTIWGEEEDTRISGALAHWNDNVSFAAQKCY